MIITLKRCHCERKKVCNGNKTKQKKKLITNHRYGGYEYIHGGRDSVGGNETCKTKKTLEGGKKEIIVVDVGISHQRLKSPKKKTRGDVPSYYAATLPPRRYSPPSSEPKQM